MRLFSIFYILLFLNTLLSAQVPHGFNYQAVARNTDGTLLANKDISFRISLLHGKIDGSSVYSEVHKITTNKMGMVSLKIGEGSFPTSNFDDIDWGSGKFFIKVEMDAQGGTDYMYMGTSQLLSVPYAMYAEKSSNGISKGAQNISGEKTFMDPIKGNLVGAVTLNSNAPPVAGSIRWTGEDFEGYNGDSWISLTAGGGASHTDSWQCGDPLVDTRDGQAYGTALIGNQCWMTDNLNFDTGAGSYAGEGAYAPEMAGRYYNWAAAMGIDQAFNNTAYKGSDEEVQGVCPNGWHLPSHNEWIILEDMAGGDGILLEGTEGLGFDMLFTGDRLTDGVFANSGTAAIYWTATQETETDAWKRIIFINESFIDRIIIGKEFGFSVRCVKD